MQKLTDFHLPVDLGEFNIQAEEVMYYLYLPIHTKNSGNMWLLPDERLNFITPLIDAVMADVGYEQFAASYLYVTIKKMYVGGGVTPNRPGWHCDGFMSDDLNYVWYDCIPTVFVQGEFSITPDHTLSLQEFDEQAEPGWQMNSAGRRGRSQNERHVTYPVKHLLKLDDRVIHKVNTKVPEQVMRTFVKLTLSKERYNLKDNSRNPLLPDSGPMYERSLVRNDPHQAQRDHYVRPEPIDDHFM